MRKAILLNSGGMDTFLLAQHLLKQGIEHEHVFVDVGQDYAEKEEAAAMFIASTVGAVFHRMPGAQLARYEHPSGIIPFRNAELILNAAQYGDDIYMGVIADEINSDKSEDFMHAMEGVLNESHRAQYWTQGRTFKLHTPLRQFTKSQLVAWYLDDGGYANVLLRTVSCYDGGAKHCGNCASCFKRWVALVNAKVQVGEEHFDRNPLHWHTPAQWAATLPGYPMARRAEVARALQAAGMALPAPTGTPSAGAGPVEAGARPLGA